jgi:hypothetical protein
MPIRYLKRHAALEGQVTAEDAEALVAWLRAGPGRGVHLGKLVHLHAAVLQVLLALKPPLVAPSPDARLAAVLAPVHS